MNIKQFEDDIKARLQSKISTATYSIIVMEDSEEEVSRVAGKPQITVAYYQSDFDPAKSTAEISQEESVVFSIFLKAKQRRSDHGIYVMFGLVKAALLGWTPPQCFQKIQLRQFQFQTNDDGHFIYQIAMETKSLQVQEHTEPTAPLSTEITLENPTRLS